MSEGKIPFVGVTLISGCMFSGKTNELLSILFKYILAEKRVCLIRKRGYDRKGLDMPGLVVARQTGLRMQCTDVKDLAEISIDDSHDVYGIDEAQTFENIGLFCKNALLKRKMVVVAMLNGTFEQKPFSNAFAEVAALATRQINLLVGVCMRCKSADAVYTVRISDELEVEVVGNDKQYQCVCLECWINIHEQK